VGSRQLVKLFAFDDENQAHHFGGTACTMSPQARPRSQRQTHARARNATVLPFLCRIAELTDTHHPVDVPQLDSVWLRFVKRGHIAGTMRRWPGCCVEARTRCDPRRNAISVA
jgi:hypothetical protein